MNKIKIMFNNNKKSFIFSFLVLLVVLYFAFGRGNAQVKTYEVKRADVTQSVLLSGKVQTTDKADLGFAASGRLANIIVKNNQAVAKGATLAQLEIGDLLADLNIKQANLRTSNVDLEAAKNELDRVKTQEETKVESAYRKLLSNDLDLVPSYNDYQVNEPIINGIYVGKEGQYKINVDKVNINSTDYEIRTFNLERITATINENGTTPVGTKGLYVSFSDPIADYKDTTWYLDIPNKAGSSYVANFNSYNEAKKGRDLAVQSAEFKYKKLLTESDSGASSSIAQAEIQKINAEIRKNTIYAPFAGKVTNIEREVGENASVGERVISILGEEKLEVVLQVSELDVSRIPAGSQIKITLDAFPGEEFMGTLNTINSRDTTIDGVPVYEAFVELSSDLRIKTGMSASATIVLATKSQVLTVPSYLIEKADGKDVVEVMNSAGKAEQKEVTVGMTSTDSMVEIISGLNLGDRVIVKSAK